MLDALLKHACETADWEYGEAWLQSQDSDLLRIGDAWFVHPMLSADRQHAWQQFRACSEEFVLRLGEGLPGRVGQSQQPEWIDDVSVQTESYFLRNQIAIAFGARAGYGLPALIDSTPIILVFFLSEARSPDSQRIKATEGAIAQLIQSSHR